MDKGYRLNREKSSKGKRGVPHYSGAQQHWSKWPGPNNPITNGNGGKVPHLSEEFRNASLNNL